MALADASKAMGLNEMWLKQSCSTAISVMPSVPEQICAQTAFDISGAVISVLS
jgi:hypothetical protein